MQTSEAFDPTAVSALSEAPVLYLWSFGEIEFDEGRWELSVAGEAVSLERKPLDVLQYLLRHAGEAVTKEELLASVWEGRVVVEASLTNAIGKLRRALRDENQSIILTLPRVGYRLDAKVQRSLVEHIPEVSRLQPGDSVPRRSNWRLEQALDRRGDSEVWLARHSKTGQSRVFKFSLDGRRLTGLKREVTVGRLLAQALGSRPDLVGLIDWDFEQAPYFVEFEYGGVSLDRQPNIEALPQDRRIELFLQALDAVAAAHGVGVLHKDLKPANLLVDNDGDQLQLRVTDFGSSRVYQNDALAQLGITMLGMTQTQLLSSETGTPLYLAPEVLAGESPTIKSDVYALGVTLYQLLTGDFRRPLASGWEQDIGDPLLRRDIADAAHGDPEQRLESVSQLAERLRSLDERRREAELDAMVRKRIDLAERRAALAQARRPWVIAAMAVLLAGMLTSLFYAHRSQVETRKALTAEAEAKAQTLVASNARADFAAVDRFLMRDLVGLANPMYGGGADLSLNQAIARAETRISASFVGQPRPEIKLRQMLGLIHADRGEFELAHQQYDKAIQLYSAHTELHRNNDYILRMHDANALENMGRLVEADQVLGPVVVAEREGKLQTDPASATTFYYQQASRLLNSGNHAAAATMYAKALPFALQLGKNNPAVVIRTKEYLGQTLCASGQCSRGMPYLLQARDMASTRLGPDSPETLHVELFVAEAEIADRDDAAALGHLQALQSRVAKLSGKTPWMSAMVTGDTMRAWAGLGEYAKAAALIPQDNATVVKLHGLHSTHTIGSQIDNAEIARFVDPHLAGHLLDQADQSSHLLKPADASQFLAASPLVRACIDVSAGQHEQARKLARGLSDSDVASLGEAALQQRHHQLQGTDADQTSSCKVFLHI